MLKTRVATVLSYHTRSKHALDRYAAGPGTLDWDAQPKAFRDWDGVRRIALPREIVVSDIPWGELPAPRPSLPLNDANLGSLLRLCVALTAWKEYGGSRWSLRAHPSSGNLHPTETWLIAANVAGLEDGLYHYHNLYHGLERRAWGSAAQTTGAWLGFSSIHWREAWKYGERAFRYCQLDMGHVLAAVSYAAVLHGWKPRLLVRDTADIAHALGTDRAEDFAGVESEEAEVIVELHASDAALPQDWKQWEGKAGLLDAHPLYQWPVIEEVAHATRGKPPVAESDSTNTSPPPSRGRVREGVETVNHRQSNPHPSLPPARSTPPDARPSVGLGAAPAWGKEQFRAMNASDNDIRAAQVILKRRSAQSFDGSSEMPQTLFRQLLSGLLPGGSPVWELWSHTPRVHPVMLVHRVEGVAPGVYALPRSGRAKDALRAAFRETFTWQAADAELPLFQLVAARAGKTARTLSCHQDIATHCAVIFMMLAEFAEPVAADPAAYRHLHWEAGMLGHVITLEAEAAGWRGTGIGCFFDDAVHEVLGLKDDRFQVVYHYAVGMALDDPRIATLSPYEE
ncbi:MAG: nitroreductase family protein [Nitrosomonadales bacterium]|nr:nitroreductase family protein [Nitrosomonadales bacterium]